MKFEIHKDEYGTIRFFGEAKARDLMELKLDPFERAQLQTPAKSAADNLLDLELIFRRHAEQEKK